jgi:hypothetical protein
MLTPEDVRRIALSMPEAYEADHHGMPSFRVGKKIFCTIHQAEPRTMLKLDPEDQANLAQDDPATIQAVPGYWGRTGSTFVYYQQVPAAKLRDLMRMAWAQVAPSRLTKATPP